MSHCVLAVGVADQQPRDLGDPTGAGRVVVAAVEEPRELLDRVAARERPVGLQAAERLEAARRPAPRGSSGGAFVAGELAQPVGVHLQLVPGVDPELRRVVLADARRVRRSMHRRGHPVGIRSWPALYPPSAGGRVRSGAGARRCGSAAARRTPAAPAPTWHRRGPSAVAAARATEPAHERTERLEVGVVLRPRR